MIETFLVNYDSYVRQTAKENQVPELELLRFGRRAEHGPVRTRGTALKINADILKRAPHQT